MLHTPFTDVQGFEYMEKNKSLSRVNVKLKHVILGCNNVANTSMHLGIVIISFVVYAMWLKCFLESITCGNVILNYEIK